MNETLKMSLAIDSDDNNDNNSGSILENSNFLSSLGDGAAQALVNKILNGGRDNSNSENNNNSSDNNSTTANLLSSLTATLAKGNYS